MNKIKSFFIGTLLLASTFTTVFIAVLTYRAHEQSHIKTYIFQTAQRPNGRVGPLQSLDDLKIDGLRNKLIQKYVSEYFKVIPGNDNPEQKRIVADLSKKRVYDQWLNGEAKNIEQMSKNKMFRNVWVDTSQIQQIQNSSSDWFAVPYFTQTWTESNNMSADVVRQAGVINLRITFFLNFRPETNVKKHLEQGGDPAGLFMFRVDEIAM